MNKKVKKLLATGVLVLALVLGGFAVGVHASTNWLNFTGDQQVADTSDNIDEIMDILRQVNEDKLTAEEALAELEAMNPPGLVKQIKELKDEVEELKTELAQKDTDLANKQGEIDRLSDYIIHLESELQRANEKVEGLNNKSTEAVEEAREYQ